MAKSEALSVNLQMKGIQLGSRLVHDAYSYYRNPAVNNPDLPKVDFASYAKTGLKTAQIINEGVYGLLDTVTLGAFDGTITTAQDWGFYFFPITEDFNRAYGF